jgi:pimeloyl-ACP methyl ester carboxylesterase
MRTFETLFLLLNLLAFISLLLPRWRFMRAARFLPVAAVLTAIAQWLLEGARWQLAPAYTVSAGLFFYLLSTHGRARDHAPASGPLRQLGRIVTAGICALALTLTTLIPIAVPIFRFPSPTGPYAIGTLTYPLLDQHRAEVFTADPSDRRELMVQVWYPAKPSPSKERVRYMADGSVLAPLAQLLNLPGFVFTHLNYVPTYAVLSASVADGAQTYPVLIFSHGRGGFRQHNTFQVEELVSQGYIVAAIDHPYAAAGVDFPDGRRARFDSRMLDRSFIDGVIPYLARDVSFTLDQLAVINRADPHGVLTGRLDLQRAGMFGVSLGGAVTAQACLRDARLKACLPIDNFMPDDVVRHGLGQPTMWISRDAETMRDEGWAQADIIEIQTSMRSVFQGLEEEGYLVLIPGMFHQNFSDFPYFVISPLDIWLGLDGPINAQRGHTIVNAYSLAFFERHLKGKTATPMLDGPDAQYPEVIFERHK